MRAGVSGSVLRSAGNSGHNTGHLIAEQYHIPGVSA